MADVLEINDLASLSKHRMQWDALLADMPEATFFHTYDWLAAYWRHFAQGQKLRVLVVTAAGRPVGIVPFCVRTCRHRLASLPVLTYPLDNWASHYGPIGGNPAATLWMAMRHVASTPRDWQQIDLPWNSAEGGESRRTRLAMQQAGFHPHTEAYGTTSRIDLPDTWDAYLAALNPKGRHELRRNLRRVTEWGDVEFVRHRPAPRRAGDGDPRWDLYDACEQVARESWQADSPVGHTLCHPRYRSFYRDAHAAAARLGMVDMALLTIAGRPVAFWYGYHCQGRLIGLRTGYSTEAPVSGVGTALLARLIGDSCRRGDTSIDLGPGNEKYKQRLRSHVDVLVRHTHVPTTAWQGQLVRASRWLRRKVASV